ALHDDPLVRTRTTPSCTTTPSRGGPRLERQGLLQAWRGGACQCVSNELPAIATPRHCPLASLALAHWHVACFAWLMGCSSRRACAFLLLSLAMACSRAQSTSTATQPADLTAADAATPPLEFPHPWGPASTRIAVRSFGFWDGSTRFEADRTELTPVQLGALDGLRRIPPPEGPAASDLTSYVIGITDDAGNLATY